ncbi:spermidine/putrescine ABC transporter substrate-binding protein [Natronococcus pandeyae]|uniref:Spermidine/putrescine ABC transporter substrate-binding protein n=1 Tax=Natronococcus pandeyae TaxID=2055836 RepID=A0A8J8TPJ2_9EURY|nr:PotD/PotF family extracellular solute-binding protein [Natronococcus pandeyae]TYL35950.1 spermidine/putrescine ABC transporter substrate-binding protein [Natronococcus pandeyae]
MSRHSRRQFVRGTGALSAVGITAVAGCLGSDDDDDGTLGLYSWGGSTQEALMDHVVEPFEAEYDVEVEATSFDNQDSMLSNIRSSPEGSYDIVMPSAERTYEAVQQDLLEPIRTEDIDTWNNLFPVFQDLALDPGDDAHVAPLYYGTIGMVYNTDYIDTSSPSWELLWDEEYEDRITVQDFAMLRVFNAALSLGLDPNTLESDGSYEDGLEMVYDAMAEQHELVRTYWGSGQEQVTQYQEESSYVGTGWGGRILALQDEGYDQLEYAIPEEGAKGWSDMLAIAKGSENRELAEQFIGFAYQDEVIQDLSPEIGYPPATGVETDEIEALPDFDPSGGEGLLFEDPEFIDEHEDEWMDTFDAIKMGEY